MAIHLENFKIKNNPRGRATLLATFSVNLGAISLNGFELVEVDNKRFVSEPHRRYQVGGSYKKYSYVWFNEGKGKQLEGEIEKLAIQEYDRRTAEQEPVRSHSAVPMDNDPFEDFDDLPF